VDVIAHSVELSLHFLQVFIGAVLEIDEPVARGVRGADQLVEFEMNGLGIAVLRVLDKEHDEEGRNRRAGVDVELPDLRIVEVRSGEGPQKHAETCQPECPGEPSALAVSRAMSLKLCTLASC